MLPEEGPAGTDRQTDRQACPSWNSFRGRLVLTTRPSPVMPNSLGKGHPHLFDAVGCGMAGTRQPLSCCTSHFLQPCLESWLWASPHWEGSRESCSRMFPLLLPWPRLLLPASHVCGAFLRLGISTLLSKELKDISKPALPENIGMHLHLLSSCTHIQLLERSDSLPRLNSHH